MVIALVLVALAMIAGGGYAIYDGLPFISLERGWTYVISGAVSASGGLLLLGIAVAAHRLRRIERRLRELIDRMPAAGALPLAAAPSPAPAATPPPKVEPTVAEPPPRPAAAPAAPPTPAAPPPRREPAAEADIFEPAAHKPTDRPPPPPRPAAPPPPATVIGTYNSGGNEYVMYSDGSIEAETPKGRYRFKSLDELKEFVAAGGESPRAGA